MSDAESHGPTEAALRNEFADWIKGHPRAGLFDWTVAAQNVERVIREQLCQELAETIRQHPERDEKGYRITNADLAEFVERFGKATTDG